MQEGHPAYRADARMGGDMHALGLLGGGWASYNVTRSYLEAPRPKSSMKIASHQLDLRCGVFGNKVVLIER